MNIFKRPYKFEIEVGGIPFLHCNRISGIGENREVIEFIDRDGNTIPYVGGRGFSHLEIHDVSPTSFPFIFWYKSTPVIPLNGAIMIHLQSGLPGQIVTFSDMLPEGFTLDDLDRKIDDIHGVTYRVVCIIRGVS